jgi:hypothetical protein
MQAPDKARLSELSTSRSLADPWRQRSFAKTDLHACGMMPSANLIKYVARTPRNKENAQPYSTTKKHVYAYVRTRVRNRADR